MILAKRIDSNCDAIYTKGTRFLLTRSFASGDCWSLWHEGSLRLYQTTRRNCIDWIETHIRGRK